MSQVSKTLIAVADASLPLVCHVMPGPRVEPAGRSRRVLPYFGWTLDDVEPVVVGLFTSSHERKFLADEELRSLLVAAGAAGAIAGLVVEACHPVLQMLFWADWRTLENPGLTGIGWEDERLIELGSNDPLANPRFDFTRVVQSQPLYRRGVTAAAVAQPTTAAI